MFCWNLHQIYVKIFGVEMKFNDKNCKRKLRRKWRKKTIHFSIIIPYWFLFFIEQFNIDWDSSPKNPFNYLSIYVILKQSIAKRDLDDSISCSYYKKEWWCWKFSLTTKCMSALFHLINKNKTINFNLQLHKWWFNTF